MEREGRGGAPPTITPTPATDQRTSYHSDGREGEHAPLELEWVSHTPPQSQKRDSSTRRNDDSSIPANDDQRYHKTHATTRRNANGKVSTVYSGNRIRYLKKEDGQPFWRKDLQYNFLRRVFDNDKPVFTNVSTGSLGHTFADIYIDAMKRSSKTSSTLRDRLVDHRDTALNLAMVCLLVNVGRMNTTLNFFPEMRARVRTYHSIPVLQVHAGNQADKQLQDGPRLKSILKAAMEDERQPSTIDQIMSLKKPPRTNPVNLIFMLSQYSPRVSETHFPPNLDFFDLFMKPTLTSESRATAFLWLMWWYLEGDFSAEASEKNPFGPGIVSESGGVSNKIPTLVSLTEEEADAENADTEEEKAYAEAKRLERAAISASEYPPMPIPSRIGVQTPLSDHQQTYSYKGSGYHSGSESGDSRRGSTSPGRYYRNGVDDLDSNSNTPSHLNGSYSHDGHGFRTLSGAESASSPAPARPPPQSRKGIGRGNWPRKPKDPSDTKDRDHKSKAARRTSYKPGYGASLLQAAPLRELKESTSQSLTGEIPLFTQSPYEGPSSSHYTSNQYNSNETSHGASGHREIYSNTFVNHVSDYPPSDFAAVPNGNFVSPPANVSSYGTSQGYYPHSGSADGLASTFSVSGHGTKRPRGQTQHQVAMEKSRNARVKVLLDRHRSALQHTKRRERSRRGPIVDAWIKCKSLPAGWDSDNDESSRVGGIDDIPLNFAPGAHDDDDDYYGDVGETAHILARSFRRVGRLLDGVTITPPTATRQHRREETMYRADMARQAERDRLEREQERMRQATVLEPDAEYPSGTTETLTSAPAPAPAISSRRDSVAIHTPAHFLPPTSGPPPGTGTPLPRVKRPYNKRKNVVAKDSTPSHINPGEGTPGSETKKDGRQKSKQVQDIQRGRTDGDHIGESGVEKIKTGSAALAGGEDAEQTRFSKTRADGGGDVVMADI